MPDRSATYGPPHLNHGCTAALWSAYLSRRLNALITLSARDVCWMNILQKIGRDAHEAYADNVADTKGYADNIEHLSAEPIRWERLTPE